VASLESLKKAHGSLASPIPSVATKRVLFIEYLSLHGSSVGLRRWEAGTGEVGYSVVLCIGNLCNPMLPAVPCLLKTSWGRHHATLEERLDYLEKVSTGGDANPFAKSRSSKNLPWADSEKWRLIVTLGTFWAPLQFGGSWWLLGQTHTWARRIESRPVTWGYVKQLQYWDWQKLVEQPSNNI